MPNKFPFTAMASKLERTLRRLPRQMGVLIVGESKGHFRKQRFYSDKWPKRKSGSPRDKRRNLLVDTGTLRRSIRSEARGNTIRIISDVVYASVHNTGGKVKKRKPRRGRKSKRKGGATFNMPKRQFIGDAPQLRKKLNGFVNRQIQKALKVN